MKNGRANVDRLAAVLREQRERSGQSLRALAAASGVDLAYLSRIENAAFDAPNPVYLRAVALALGCSPVELLLAAGYLSDSDVAEWIERTRRSKRQPPATRAAKEVS